MAKYKSLPILRGKDDNAYMYGDLHVAGDVYVGANAGSASGTKLIPGGGGSDLPEVTSADNGKVLGVVSGEWDKMNAPASKVYRHDVSITYADSEAGSSGSFTLTAYSSDSTAFTADNISSKLGNGVYAAYGRASNGVATGACVQVRKDSSRLRAYYVTFDDPALLAPSVIGGITNFTDDVSEV